MTWAARFPATSLPAALPLRVRPGVEAHVSDTFIWLRGPSPLDDATQAAIQVIPAVERFTVDAAGLLTPAHRRLPVGPLPPGPWTPFADVARLHLPPAALPAVVTGRTAVRLVPAGVLADVAALLVPLDRWAAYAIAAPQVRLDRLRFAVRADGTALIVGRPPPPLPGAEWVDHGGLLLPAGLAWHPPVDAATLRRALGLPAGDLALFHRDGSHERIPADALLPATRAAVRRTVASLSARLHRPF